jgi:hypothetical protein
MPPQPTPLCDNRPYRVLNCLLTKGAQIIGAHKAGSSLKEIEDELDHSREAVRKTLESIYIRDEGHTLSRNGTLLNTQAGLVGVCFNAYDLTRKYPMRSVERPQALTGLPLRAAFIRSRAQTQHSNVIPYISPSFPCCPLRCSPMDRP